MLACLFCSNVHVMLTRNNATERAVSPTTQFCKAVCEHFMGKTQNQSTMLIMTELVEP